MLEREREALRREREDLERERKAETWGTSHYEVLLVLRFLKKCQVKKMSNSEILLKASTKTWGIWDFPKIVKESVVSVSDVFGFKLVKLEKQSPFSPGKRQNRPAEGKGTAGGWIRS